MDRIVPLRRFLSWLIDRLLFLAAGVAVLFIIQLAGFPGSGLIRFDLYDLIAIQVPLTLLITYAIWFGVVITFGPPGRRLTGTDVRRRQGGAPSLPMKLTRSIVKLLLHITVIGFIVDAVFICVDRAERRSIPDRMAGTVVARRC